jgi:hypothetical protein
MFCLALPCPIPRTCSFSLFCMTSACRLYNFVMRIIVCLGKVESCVQIADRCAPWKFSNGAQNLVLHALQFQEVGFSRFLCLSVIKLFRTYFDSFAQYSKNSIISIRFRPLSFRLLCSWRAVFSVGDTEINGH